MHNRKAGSKPARSRHCMVERILLSHWETGKAKGAMTPSQENYLFNIHQLTYERQEGEVSFYLRRCKQKDFLLSSICTHSQALGKCYVQVIDLFIYSRYLSRPSDSTLGLGRIVFSKQGEQGLLSLFASNHCVAMLIYWIANGHAIFKSITSFKRPL